MTFNPSILTVISVHLLKKKKIPSVLYHTKFYKSLFKVQINLGFWNSPYYALKYKIDKNDCKLIRTIKTSKVYLTWLKSNRNYEIVGLAWLVYSV